MQIKLPKLTEIIFKNTNLQRQKYYFMGLGDFFVQTANNAMLFSVSIFTYSQYTANNFFILQVYIFSENS